MRLGVEARIVTWRRGAVTIEARNVLGPLPPPVRARALVVTLPLGVLMANPRTPGAVRFDPPLPADKRHAIRTLQVGPVVRTLLRFRHPLTAVVPGKAPPGRAVGDPQRR